MATLVTTPIRTATWSAACVVLLIFMTGCYTQLGYIEMDREPDYEDITVYETATGDSVVVEKYYHDNVYTFGHTHRYRRYFSHFYGLSLIHISEPTRPY